MLRPRQDMEEVDVQSKALVPPFHPYTRSFTPSVNEQPPVTCLIFPFFQCDA